MSCRPCSEQAAQEVSPLRQERQQPKQQAWQQQVLLPEREHLFSHPQLELRLSCRPTLEVRPF